MPIAIIRSIRELPAGMEKHEAEWALLCLMERGEAQIETTVNADGTETLRSVGDKRQERWDRNGDT